MHGRKSGLFILACLLTAASVSQARADIIVDRSLDHTRPGQFSNLDPPDPHQQVADRFVLSQAMTLDSLLWYGGYREVLAQADFAFTIRLFADDAGKPGLAPLAQANVTVAGPLLAPVAGDLTIWRNYSTSLPGWAAGPGTYWLSILESDALTPASGDTQWLWGDTSGTGIRAIRDLDTGAWSAGRDWNHAFRLEGRAIPEPAVLLLLGVGLVGLGSRVRRMRSS